MAQDHLWAGPSDGRLSGDLKQSAEFLADKYRTVFMHIYVTQKRVRPCEQNIHFASFYKDGRGQPNDSGC